MMENRLGIQWKILLPLLWKGETGSELVAKVRYTFMDIVTHLVKENFSGQLGTWCETHGVEYIGHIIEDNNSHARLGPSLGHYFRGVAGQHMAGIDCIGGQVLPAGVHSPDKQFLGNRDGEFYHYILGKLGSSCAAIDPIKQGRTMCEIFGASGWELGVRDMKYLLDHFLVRGVNHFVPHAFSCMAYPDPDCPPHFYANGHDPQFRHFGELMRYTNRVCNLISDGKSITPIALLYHAEAEWTGSCMLDQKPAHILLDHQIDFDIIPSDIFSEKDRYKTSLSNGFSINNKQYQGLIIPQTEYITQATLKGIIQLKECGFPVIFIGELPRGILAGELSGEVKELLKLDENDCIPLDLLVQWIEKMDLAELHIKPSFSSLRYLHYKDELDIYMFSNESVVDTFDGVIQMPTKGKAYCYDAWNNVRKELRMYTREQGSELHLTIEPYQSVIVIFEELEEDVQVQPLREFRHSEVLMKEWKVSLSNAKEYPKFHESHRIDQFESIALRYPSFSGYISYETQIDMPNSSEIWLSIEDAFEGVEVFVNSQSVGLQIVPPFFFDLSHDLKQGKNELRIEVATKLERERHFAEPIPGDFMVMFKKEPMLQPTGIIGEVKLHW